MKFQEVYDHLRAMAALTSRRAYFHQDFKTGDYCVRLPDSFFSGSPGFVAGCLLLDLEEQLAACPDESSKTKVARRLKRARRLAGEVGAK